VTSSHSEVCRSGQTDERRGTRRRASDDNHSIVEELAQDLEDIASTLREPIQKEKPVVYQRHVAAQRHLPAADQPRIRDGLVGRATRAGDDQRRAIAGAAGDAVDAGGVESF
jgi:hypothetical protein